MRFMGIFIITVCVLFLDINFLSSFKKKEIKTPVHLKVPWYYKEEIISWSWITKRNGGNFLYPSCSIWVNNMAIQALCTIDNDHSSLGSSSYLLQEFLSWIRTIPAAIGFKDYTLYRGLQKSMHLLGRGGKGKNWLLCNGIFVGSCVQVIILVCDHSNESYWAVLLCDIIPSFITLCKVVVVFQMKAIEQHFHVVLFIMLYKVVLDFKPVDETLMCDHSNESCQAVLSCGTVYCVVHIPPFNPKDETIQILSNSYSNC